MQCTGLKDKNGKLIYNGDIVKYPARKIAFEVYWDVLALKYILINRVALNINKEINNWFPNRCKIIGNIYENPELMEDKENENN